MKVNIVGRHVRVTPDLESYAREKITKMDRFFAGIQHVDVVMEVDAGTHLVETAAVLGSGTKLVGKAEAEDMYAAIDLAEGRLKKQIRRFHSRLKDHRDRKRITHKEQAVPPEEMEATYERIVREMLEEDRD